jgi:hypothetical protein
VRPIVALPHAPGRIASLVSSAQARVNTAKMRIESDLEATDAEVRAHEHAHVAALGRGVIRYDTVVGPDGRSYAVGGGVSVDLSPVPGDPEATLRKAKAAIQAAYAVGEPSAADMNAAAEAYQLEMAAQHQIEREQEAGGPQSWWA